MSRPLGVASRQFLGIVQNLRVIEGEGVGAPIADPAGGSRVVPGPWRRWGLKFCEERRRHRMTTRIAVRVRINTDQAKSAYLQPRFLAHFAAASRLNGLADIDEPTRQRQGTLEGMVFATDEKHTPVRIEDDAIDRQCGGLGKSHSAILTECARQRRVSGFATAAAPDPVPSPKDKRGS